MTPFSVQILGFEDTGVTTWPFKAEPQPGEILSSWLSRLAEGHGLSLHSLCSSSWPGRHVLAKDIDRSPSPDFLQDLASKSGVPLDRIQGLTFEGLTGRLFERCDEGQARVSWILPIHLRSVRSHGAQFCPDCLSEATPFFRRDWRLSFVTLCLRHGKMLSERCPSCTQALNPLLCFGGLRRNTGAVPLFLCNRCGWDLRKPAPSDNTTLGPHAGLLWSFQERLDLAVRDNWILQPGQGAIHSIPWFRGIQILLRHLSNGRRSRHLRWAVQGQMNLPMDFDMEVSLEGFHLFEQLPTAYRARMLLLVAWLLEEWPARFIAACRDARVFQARLVGDQLEPAPYWLWTVAREHLSLKRQRWRRAVLPSGMLVSYRELGERLSREASVLREKRLKFIQDHPELHASPWNLVREMKAHGLYSRNSALSILVQHTSALIAKAQSRPSLLDILSGSDI